MTPEEEFNQMWIENIKSADPRPISIKCGITGCMNCNIEGCRNGSKYKQYPDTNSDACANRVFAGDDELYAYIDSQYH